MQPPPSSQDDRQDQSGMQAAFALFLMALGMGLMALVLDVAPQARPKLRGPARDRESLGRDAAAIREDMRLAVPRVYPSEQEQL